MRVGGSEYLKRPEENQEGERGFVGGGLQGQRVAGFGGFRTERASLNWANWPETVVSHSTPKKTVFALWGWGWGGVGWGEGHRRIRVEVVWKLCSEA